MKLTFDLWVLLLSPSGSGRDTCLRPARRILELTGLDIVRTEDFGSPEAAKQQVAERPYGLYLFPEFSILMKKLNSGQFGDLREWITGLYDSLDIPAGIHYRKHPGKPGADTPPIDFKQAPRLNILATCARDYLTSNLQVEDTTGGFLPRWTIANLPDSDRCIPKPQKRNPKPERFFREFLQKAANLR